MKIAPATENTWKFWCPGCDSAHMVSESWQINTETATISPSVLVYGSKKLINEDLTGDALTAPENVTTTPRCHSFVTNGQIQYLDDSTHALAGQTVELPDWVDALDDMSGEEQTEPNQYGCTCPCLACRDDYCAMCEMGYP